MNDKVSIIMPCYNDGKYIREAIQSVKEQTYKNIEIIVIDDGSDDEETRDVLDSLTVDVTVLQTNHLRPAGARNYGIQNAKGKYILPLDSDDKIEPSYVEKAVKILESNKNVGVVYCQADLFGEKRGRWDLPDYSFDKMLLDNVVFVTALFYRQDWQAVGGFNTQMLAGMEDYDFWLAIMALGREIYQIPEVLFHYRIKPTSRTTSFQSDYIQMQATYRQIYDNHREFYELHRERYAKILRDALVEQIAVRMKYEKTFQKVEKYYRKPILGKILKRIML